MRDHVWSGLSNVGALQRTCGTIYLLHPTQPAWGRFRETLNFGVFQQYLPFAVINGTTPQSATLPTMEPALWSPSGGVRARPRALFILGTKS